MDKRIDLTTQGKKHCPSCGQDMPFWYVTCPKCHASLDKRENSSIKPPSRKIIRIVSKITPPEDKFTLFHDVKLYYSVDNAISWKSVDMDPQGEKYVAEIPEMPPSARIVYFIEAADITGKTLVEDNGGEFFTYQVEQGAQP